MSLSGASEVGHRNLLAEGGRLAGVPGPLPEESRDAKETPRILAVLADDARGSVGSAHNSCSQQPALSGAL